MNDINNLHGIANAPKSRGTVARDYAIIALAAVLAGIPVLMPISSAFAAHLAKLASALPGI